MSLFQGAATAAPRPPCAACGQPADAEVWDCHVCFECHGAWFSDERFTVGAIEAATGAQPYGPDVVADRELEHRRFCAEARRRTQAWAMARRRRAHVPQVAP